VQQTVAIEGKGIPELIDQVMAHKIHLYESGDWLKREKERSRREVEGLLQARFMAQVRTAVPPTIQDQLVTAVAERTLDPYTAVAQFFKRVANETSK
jgi:LAO/AO transport system kinase